MGQREHGKSRGLYFFLWKRRRIPSMGIEGFFCTPQNSISSILIFTMSSTCFKPEGSSSGRRDGNM